MSAIGGKADIQCPLSGTDAIFRREFLLSGVKPTFWPNSLDVCLQPQADIQAVRQPQHGELRLAIRPSTGWTHQFVQAPCDRSAYDVRALGSDALKGFGRWASAPALIQRTMLSKITAPGDVMKLLMQLSRSSAPV
jgi:hypothetical protein